MSTRTVCAGELKIFHKDSNATLDYIWDWTDWLGDDQDTLMNHSFTTSSPELTIELSEQTEQTATVWLKGGIPYTNYFVTCHVHTMGGRDEDRTAHFLIVSR